MRRFGRPARRYNAAGGVGCDTGWPDSRCCCRAILGCVCFQFQVGNRGDRWTNRI